VRRGDAVQAGQPLGLVGLSGHTEFAHLHFEVRRHGNAVDPFVGLDGGQPCRPGDRPLWSADALEALSYTPTGLLGAGIAGAPPVVNDGIVDRDNLVSFTAASGVVVFWVQIYGAWADDLEVLRLIAPDGRVLVERRRIIPHDHTQWLAYLGRRAGGGTWADGKYRGEYALYRGPSHAKVIAVSRETDVGPEA
jgi:hypothetical protein